MNSRRAWFEVILAVALLAPQAIFAQNAQTAAIGRIVHQANRVDRNIGDRAAKMKTFTRGDESGLLSLYQGTDRERKLVVQLVSTKSGDVSEYYFLNNRLIYVVQACRSFESTARNGTPGGCSAVSENRYYLSRGNLIAWLSGTGPGPLTMREVVTDGHTRAAKLGQITRSASIWLAFAESPATDFNRFESEPGN